MAKTAKQNRGKTLRRIKKGIAKASKRFVKNVKQLSARGRNILGRAKKMKIWGGKHDGKKVVLLIIDPQNDFTDSDVTFKKLSLDPKEGLPVVGATNDFNNIIAMLKGKMGNMIDEIHISLDSHTKTHIGHVGFWKRLDGIDVKPGVVFEVVTEENGTKKIVNKYNEPKIEYQAKKPELQEWAIKYIEEMNKNGKPDPLIWNEHCIKGSDGWMVYQPLWNAIIEWRNNGKGGQTLYVHEKGENDLCEMYSIMKAEVTYEELLGEFVTDAEKIKSTQDGLDNPTVPDFIPVSENTLSINVNPNLATTFNEKLYKSLCGESENQNILLICGEAKSHCVKSSATDIVEQMKTTNHKPNHVYILEDAMSSVNLGNDPAVESLNKLFQGFSEEFIKNMSREGANITTCSNVYNELTNPKV